MHVYMCLRVEESVYLFVYLSVCLLASLSIYLSFLMFVCLSVSIYICLSVCLSHRQQIEDCETEIQRLKELLKKREENERKYHGQLGAFLHPRPNHSALSSPLLVNMSTLGRTVPWPVYLFWSNSVWKLWSYPCSQTPMPPVFMACSMKPEGCM